MKEHGYLDVRIIGRAHEHSVVRRAAQNARVALFDARLQQAWDFSSIGGVFAQFVLPPPGAPAWASNREALWNAVEACERRGNAQLAREFVISLPRTLSLGDQTQLLRQFIGERFAARGMVADCVLRTPNPPVRARSAIHPVAGPWAYVLLTMREVLPAGFGAKRRDWNDRDLKNNTRPAWELAANRALADAGSTERIHMNPRDDAGRFDLESA